MEFCEFIKNWRELGVFLQISRNTQKGYLSSIPVLAYQFSGIYTEVQIRDILDTLFDWDMIMPISGGQFARCYGVRDLSEDVAEYLDTFVDNGDFTMKNEIKTERRVENKPDRVPSVWIVSEHFAGRDLIYAICVNQDAALIQWNKLRTKMVAELVDNLDDYPACQRDSWKSKIRSVLNMDPGESFEFSYPKLKEWSVE
ncbi:hypothetical protein [Bacteroides sp.]|uniref:hypothetical protein n=1 Tax=Bacteroides sp. TaxID=29523 RepID=UPI002625486E|nr:hypothetical protein [Bacteroides sp.]MDD3039029.1 hypothetical protein [Bacteroides sp.]